MISLSKPPKSLNKQTEKKWFVRIPKWNPGTGVYFNCVHHHQIKVEFSMKFTSRDLSLKRTPSKKQSGVFGVKINVVTKWVSSRLQNNSKTSLYTNLRVLFPLHHQWSNVGVTAVCVHRRERSKVPYIVRQCIEEVEKRGIDEVGIYRISGVATDIQALKAAFDTSKSLPPVSGWLCLAPIILNEDQTAI